MSPQRRRKRCPFCSQLFWPDPRTRHRQWACGAPDCQALRKQHSQRQWRQKHPADDTARRFVDAIAQARPPAPAPALPAPRPPAMALFPWREARDELPLEVFVSFAFSPD